MIAFWIPDKVLGFVFDRGIALLGNLEELEAEYNEFLVAHGLD